ncbi:MAG TPA: hypothetical protein VFM70_10225 [Salinimicrobium sp.]|nr:hypothetical protein [Salinimicrobium sp.]
MGEKSYLYQSAYILNKFYRNLFLLLVGLAIFGCSTNKDRFINRSYHAVTAKYNILYNGDLALDMGKEELKAGYIDNYWDILPVERMQVSEEILLPGQSKNQNFQRAEEKAAKAIQKHSMYIDGVEVNPKMDEAFLLLGKARYYDQRFIPALEAFNYILHKYPTGNNINHAKIWREKTNIRLNNDELAKKNLKEILSQDSSLEEQDIADASAMLSQAYINLQQLDSAIAPIKNAAALTENNEEKGRYFFIAGQLYDRLGEIDSANIAFDNVIALNRKAPREYMINAYLEKAQNFDFEKRDELALLELLKELREDRENRPYLDIINYQTAEVYRKLDSTETAVEFYNNSLKTKSRNDYLVAQNYVNIGNINFDARNYSSASAYYDSTLTKLEQNTREFRSIRRKRDNLADVVLYEGIATRNDSILRLTKMTEDERLAYFTNYTDSLRKQDEFLKENAEKESFENNLMASNNNSATSTFYFYNTGSLNYGKLEFQRIWGSIELADNWKTNPQEISSGKNEASTTETEVSDELNPKYHPGNYIAAIPQKQSEIDSIFEERNFANYQLGIIYKEKFQEYDLAINNFKTLLGNNPEERLILPSKYHLYKIYVETENISEAEEIKRDILSNYPESRYASIILNPNSVLAEENNPADLYATLYRSFENEKFQQVIDSSDLFITRFNGDEIVPKFELLKANAIGRLNGYEAYKEAINYVALNYPQSEEGKKAQLIYSKSIPALANKSFIKDTEASEYKLIFPFSISEKESIEELTEILELAFVEFGVEDLEVSADIYNPQQIFVVVHHLDSRLGAEGFAEMLKESDFKVERTSYPIATENYKTVQIHKNFDQYINTL